jgi:hypothetical protein
MFVDDHSYGGFCTGFHLQRGFQFDIISEEEEGRDEWVWVNAYRGSGQVVNIDVK